MTAALSGGGRFTAAPGTPTIHQMEEQPLKVTLTESELAGDYIVAERAPDGSVQLVRDTSDEAIAARLGLGAADPEDFERHFGHLAGDDEG